MEIKKEVNKKHIQEMALANEPYSIEKINIYTPSLKKIFKISEDKYIYFLNLLNLNEQIKEQQKENIQINLFDIIIIYLNSNEEKMKQIGKDIIEMLHFFLCKDNEQIYMFNDNTNKFFYIGNLEDKKIIHKKNLDNIIKVIKIQNNIIKNKKEEKYKPANKKAAELIKKQQELDKRCGKAELVLQDLISILASKGNNLNILNIWNLNIYQFYNQLKRLPINENYEIQKYLLGNAYAGKSIDFDKNNYFIKIK